MPRVTRRTVARGCSTAPLGGCEPPIPLSLLTFLFSLLCFSLSAVYRFYNLAPPYPLPPSKVGALHHFARLGVAILVWRSDASHLASSVRDFLVSRLSPAALSHIHMHRLPRPPPRSFSPPSRGGRTCAASELRPGAMRPAKRARVCSNPNLPSLRCLQARLGGPRGGREMDGRAYPTGTHMGRCPPTSLTPLPL